jgi:hypothetical protein
LAFWKERRIVTGEMVDCEVMISFASSVVCVVCAVVAVGGRKSVGGKMCGCHKKTDIL